MSDRKRDPNPFDVLGIARTGLTGLSHEQIKKLVAAKHRFLIEVWHPDRSTGNRQRFDAVQKANEALDDEEGFKFWLKSFRSGGKKQLELVQAELGVMNQQCDELKSALSRYWSYVIRRLDDTVKQSVHFQLLCQRGKLSEYFGVPEPQLDTPFLMTVDSVRDGHWQLLDRVELDSKKKKLPDGVVFPQVGGKKPYAWKTRARESGHSSNIWGIKVGKLIGCIPDDKVQLIIESELPEVATGLPSAGIPDEPNRFVSLQRFMSFAQFVQPEIVEYSELVFAEMDPEEDGPIGVFFFGRPFQLN